MESRSIDLISKKNKLSTKKLCNMEARPGRKLVREIAQKLCKKLLETKTVARNTSSCQKVGEQLVESSRKKGEWGRGARLLNKALFGEASPRGPVPYP